MCIKVSIVPDSQVQQFEDALGTLPADVTRDDEELVAALRKLYDSLTDDQKKQIPEDDAKKMEAAEKKIEELKAADQSIADTVSGMIDPLPDPTAVKEEDRVAVEAVVKQYDALTDKQKALIPQEKREKLEALREALKKKPEDEAAAESFTTAVNALLESKAGTTKSLLDDATAIYNTMTDAQKALVSPETMALYNEAVAAFKKDRQFGSGDGYYKVLSNGDVTYLKPASRIITNVTVPNQVKKGKFLFKVIKVSKNAFRNCGNLKWAVIDKNVRVFGEYVFARAYNLKKVRVLGYGFKSGKVTNAFVKAGKKGKLTVKVPGHKVDEYQKLFTGEGKLNGKVEAA